jgi:hypothetical protein
VGGLSPALNFSISNFEPHPLGKMSNPGWRRRPAGLPRGPGGSHLLKFSRKVWVYRSQPNSSSFLLHIYAGARVRQLPHIFPTHHPLGTRQHGNTKPSVV